MQADRKIEIEGDRQFILSGVANLVQNAMKYSKEGGNIWLKSKISGDRVLIEIEDECGGIEPSKIKSLFTPYTQENADRSGLGLGLTICQTLVKAIKGRLAIRNLPNGVVVEFILPHKLK